MWGQESAVGQCSMEAWVLQRAGFLARGVKERWKLCWPMVVVLYLPKWGERSRPFHAVGMQTPTSKEGEGEAVGELPAPPAPAPGSPWC